jgi:hypothetical protein
MPFMAEAKLKNQHMMEQYKSLLRQQYTGKPTYNEAGLSMLRRLEENLSVARIREQNVIEWGWSHTVVELELVPAIRSKHSL